MPPFDPYKILRVDGAASTATIQQQFRVLAKMCHPDRPGGSEEAFKDLSQAYEILGSPDRRAAWDEFGEESLRVGFDPVTARATAAAWAARPEVQAPTAHPVHEVVRQNTTTWWSGVRVDPGSFGPTGSFGAKGPGDW
jgi:curved DNA-binding protein CbpA